MLQQAGYKTITVYPSKNLPTSVGAMGRSIDDRLVCWRAVCYNCISSVTLPLANESTSTHMIWTPKVQYEWVWTGRSPIGRWKDC